MDHKKQQSGGSSSSSFTENLFGPKDASCATWSGHFSSVFGPSSMGLGRHPSHSKNTGSSKKQEFGGPYGSGKPSTPDYTTQRGTSAKQENPVSYQNETTEPSYLSSSIHYGDQEDYSPNTQTPNTLKKDKGDTDPNGSSASRGNWWQGSLYY